MKIKVLFTIMIAGMFAVLVAAGCSKGKNGATGTTGTPGALNPSPVITGLDPTMSSFNTVITITGENFSTTPTVYCDGVPAMLVSSTATQITATGCGQANPASLYQAQVNVFANNQMSNGLNEWIVPSGYTWQFPAAFLTGPLGMVYDSTTGKLFVSDPAGIFAIDNATGWTKRIVPAGCPTCTLSYPGGITMDNSGNLLVTDYSNNTLVGINPTTGATWYILGPNNAFLSGPWGVTYANGYVYVADYTSGEIIQVNYSTLQAANLTLAPALAGSPVGVTEDGSGNLYVSTESSDTVAKIVVSGTNGTVTNNYVTGIPTGSGFAGISISGTSLLVSEYSDQALYTAPLGGGAASAMCADFSPWESNYNSSIIPDGSGGIFVADTNDGLVYHVDSACNTSTYAAGLARPYDITYLNGDFYTVNYWFANATYGDPVLQIRQDGAVRVFAQIPGGITDITPNPSGGLTVDAWDNSTVYNVSSSGVVSTLIPSSAGLTNPSAVAYDNSGNLFINSHNGSGSVTKWDGSTLDLTFATIPSGWQQSAYHDGYVYTANCYHHEVDTVNTTSGGASSVYVPSSVGISCPDGIDFDLFGNFYITNGISNGGVYRVDPQGHVTPLIANGVSPINIPNGLAISSSQLIYTVEEGGTDSRMWVIAP